MSVEHAIVLWLPLEQVRPFGDQPRTDFDVDRLDELASSIKEFGQQVAIIVRELPVPDGAVRFEIIDGERRFRACSIAGLKQVRAEVRGAKDSDHQFMQSVVANFGRESHTTQETINAVARVCAMPEYQALTRDERYRRVGALFARGPAWVESILKLWELPEPVLALIGGPRDRRLNSQVAMMLVPLRDEEAQVRLATTIVDKQMRPPAARMLIRNELKRRGAERIMGRPRKPSDDVNDVLFRVHKIRDMAELILELPMPSVRASLAARPQMRAQLVKKVGETIEALDQVRQALSRGV